MVSTMVPKRNNELHWKRNNGSCIFGGIPEGYTGKETGVLLRLKLLPNLKPDDNVLSIGCAVGAHLQPLKKRGLQTIGLDPEHRFLLEGKARGNAHNFIQAIGENTPLRDRAFDIVLIFEVLEHVIQPSKVLREAHRVLKPDGRLFITAPNKFYPFETHGLQVGQKQIENLLGIGIPFFSMAPNFLRRRFERARIYDSAELISLLRRNGFEPIRIDFMMPPLDKVRQAPIILALRKILLFLSRLSLVKRFGVSIIIVTKKRALKHSCARMEQSYTLRSDNVNLSSYNFLEVFDRNWFRI